MDSGTRTTLALPLRLTGLPITERAPMMRELEASLVKDKSYRQHPLGQEAGRFLRAMRWSDSPDTTLDTYETVLAKLARDHADFNGAADFCHDQGVDYLRAFLDRHWGDASTATKANRLSILRSFFKWELGEGRVPFNPALAIRMPKVRNRERMAYERSLRVRLVAAQPSLRDQCALQLLCRMALRKNELRLVQVRDVDLARNLLTVHGKGGKIVVLPLAFESLRDDLYLHLQGDQRGPDEYLLYPRSQRLRPMDHSSVHRWFKRCLATAGLPQSIETHEMRHSAADELWRTTGNIVLAQQLLRHESVGTTQTYLHPTREDLAAGMRLVEAAWKADG